MSEQTPPQYEKDPDAKLDYQIDWRADESDGGPYLEDGETISTSTWDVPAGLTQVTPAPSIVSGEKTVIWLSGGTVGEWYRVVNSIVTSAGRDDDRSIMIFIKQK